MVDSELILMVVFGMPVILAAIVIGNIIDSQKFTENTSNNIRINEWKDPRPKSCQWNFHDWFRDSQNKRHYLKCSEQQHAGMDWYTVSRPMLD